MLNSPNKVKNTFFSLTLIFATIDYCSANCAFRVLDGGQPEKVDEDPHNITDITACA